MLGLYLVKVFTSLLPSYVVVNLSNIHQNKLFTSDRIYFLNGYAFDLYSVDERNNRLGPGSQWKTFPLPKEPIPENVIPWTPNNNVQKKAISIHTLDYQETATGLAFVDQIYIATRPNLDDRHANLRKMMARHQITNYEWRMKWRRDTCFEPKNKEELYRKLNLRQKPIGKNSSLFHALFV